MATPPESDTSDFLNELDDAARAALKRAREIVEMKVPKKHKQAHRFYAVQVEAAKLVLACKLKASGIDKPDDDTMKKLFDSFRVEYKKTEMVLTRRPEALPPGRVIDHVDEGTALPS